MLFLVLIIWGLLRMVMFIIVRIQIFIRLLRSDDWRQGWLQRLLVLFPITFFMIIMRFLFVVLLLVDMKVFGRFWMFRQYYVMRLMDFAVNKMGMVVIRLFMMLMMNRRRNVCFVFDCRRGVLGFRGTVLNLGVIVDEIRGRGWRGAWGRRRMGRRRRWFILGRGLGNSMNVIMNNLETGLVFGLGHWRQWRGCVRRERFHFVDLLPLAWIIINHWWLILFMRWLVGCCRDQDGYRGWSGGWGG